MNSKSLKSYFDSHYARGYFIIDLVTSIPYSWILRDYHIVSDGSYKIIYYTY